MHWPLSKAPCPSTPKPRPAWLVLHWKPPNTPIMSALSQEVSAKQTKKQQRKRAYNPNSIPKPPDVRQQVINLGESQLRALREGAQTPEHLLTPGQARATRPTAHTFSSQSSRAQIQWGRHCNHVTAIYRNQDLSTYFSLYSTLRAVDEPEDWENIGKCKCHAAKNRDLIRKPTFYSLKIKRPHRNSKFYRNPKGNQP